MIELDFACENFQKALRRASEETVNALSLKLSYDYEHPAWKDAMKHRKAS